MNAETAEKETKASEEVKQDTPEEKKTEEATGQNNSETSPENNDKKKMAEKGSAAVHNLKVLENIEVRLTVEVGNTEIKICLFWFEDWVGSFSYFLSFSQI